MYIYIYICTKIYIYIYIYIRGSGHEALKTTQKKMFSIDSLKTCISKLSILTRWRYYPHVPFLRSWRWHQVEVAPLFLLRRWKWHPHLILLRRWKWHSHFTFLSRWSWHPHFPLLRMWQSIYIFLCYILYIYPHVPFLRRWRWHQVEVVPPFLLRWWRWYPHLTSLKKMDVASPLNPFMKVEVAFPFHFLEKVEVASPTSLCWEYCNPYILFIM